MGDHAAAGGIFRILAKSWLESDSVNCSMKVGIFSYWSLLDPESARQDGNILETIACQVHGWSLQWSDVRDADNSTFKRFVDLRTFNPIPLFAFASVVSDANASVAGAALVIDDRDLASFDHRERGMNRVRIDPTLCYTMDGRPLSERLGGDLFVYASPTPSLRQAPVCAGYINMGLRGACALNRESPGFFEAFTRSLPWPEAQLFDGEFIELDCDAQTFTILNFDGLDRTPFCRAPYPITPGALNVDSSIPLSRGLYASADLRVVSPASARYMLPWSLREATLIRDGVGDIEVSLSERSHWLKSMSMACRGQDSDDHDFWVQSIISPAKSMSP